MISSHPCTHTIIHSALICGAKCSQINKESKILQLSYTIASPSHGFLNFTQYNFKISELINNNSESLLLKIKALYSSHTIPLVAYCHICFAPFVQHNLDEMNYGLPQLNQALESFSPVGAFTCTPCMSMFSKQQ